MADLLSQVAQKYGAQTNWNALRGEGQGWSVQDPLLQQVQQQYGGQSNWNALRGQTGGAPAPAPAASTAAPATSNSSSAPAPASPAPAASSGGGAATGSGAAGIDLSNTPGGSGGGIGGSGALSGLQGAVAAPGTDPMASLLSYLPKTVGSPSAGRQGLGQRQSPAMSGLLNVLTY